MEYLNTKINVNDDNDIIYDVENISDKDLIKPWIEKYRPTNIDNVVLSDINKKLFYSLLDNKNVPHLLLTGPPGTGKTTIVKNFIKKYRIKYNENDNGQTMYLNASDSRGLTNFKSNIINFINSETLFDKGNKFLVLDEVDSMNETVQKLLKNNIDIHNKTNITLILMCNYQNKIIKPLQDICIHTFFKQLPIINIYNFINNILQKENITIKKTKLNKIINNFYPDIRSTINELQNNYIYLKDSNIQYFDNDDLYTILSLVLHLEEELFVKIIHLYSINYNKTITILINIISKLIIEYSLSETSTKLKMKKSILQYKNINNILLNEEVKLVKQILNKKDIAIIKNNIPIETLIQDIQELYILSEKNNMDKSLLIIHLYYKIKLFFSSSANK